MSTSRCCFNCFIVLPHTIFIMTFAKISKEIYVHLPNHDDWKDRIVCNYCSCCLTLNCAMHQIIFIRLSQNMTIFLFSFYHNFSGFINSKYVEIILNLWLSFKMIQCNMYGKHFSHFANVNQYSIFVRTFCC